MSILNDLKMEYRIGGITQKLIFWNVGLFAIPMVLFSILSLFKIEVPFLRWDIPFSMDWLSVSSDPADLLWKPWSLLTYAFLHAGFMHILFNMLMLVFAGRLFLTFFTQKQMFGVYLLSALFAAFIFILSYNTLPLLAERGASKMVGASASIMAILIATAVYNPVYEIRLLLIGRVKLWHIAIIFVLLDLISASAGNSGGHLAHLAGALFGFLYIKLLQNGTDLTKGVSAVIDSVTNLFKPRKSTPFKKIYRNTPPTPVRVVKPATKDITQKQIDDILDKISKSGYDSLTSAEKEFLSKVGK